MKKKMSWEFYSKRRKLTLEKFLDGCKTQSDIYKRFENENVDQPVDFNELQEFEQKIKHEQEAEYVKKNLFDALKIPVDVVQVVKHEDEQYQDLSLPVVEDYEFVAFSVEKTLQNNKSSKKSKK